LRGSANQGTLALTSVLGTSLATLRWDADGATLTTPQQSQKFASVDEMAVTSLGTPLPMATLFGWLQGDATPAAGWQVDLQSRAQGRIKAWRLAPDAATEIKIILDPG
jgi:outer membrane lipoprotein LolB